MKKQGQNFQIHIVMLLLVVVTIAAYLPVLHADFVNYDDEPYVVANPVVQAGLTPGGIKWAFNIGYEGNWTPATWISHMVVRQFFGPGPAAPHAVNLLLHLANTLLLLLVLNRMTKSLWKSAFVAALFALHPMHVESVAWVVERKDVLSTLFWMLTMWAYVRYSEAPNPKRYALMLVFFTLGLMSKPTLVTLPFVLLLLDYWPLERWADASWRDRWLLVRQKIPLFAMSAGSSVLTYLAQQRGDTLGMMSRLSLASRIANAVTSYVGYITKMIWPVKLAVFYPHPGDTPIWHAMATFLILAAVTVLVLRSARSRPYLIVGWLWYLIVLVPMIGLVQVGGQAIADRYTYVPYIGLFIMIAWGVSDLFSHRVSASAGLRVVPMLLVVVLAGCTWRQTGYWRDSVTLWKHTLAVTTGNDVAHRNLGTALFRIGRFGEAADEYKHVILIRPYDAESHCQLGTAYDALGKYPEAMDEYKQAIRIKPLFALAHCNLGTAYGKVGKYTQAIDEYKLAISIDPGFVSAHFNLGYAYTLMHKTTLAMEEYKILTKIQPQAADKLLEYVVK